MLLLLCSICSLLLWIFRRRRPLFSRTIKRFAARKDLACIVVFFSALLLWIAIKPFHQPFVPQVQDEFSYLLASDTFAHGRLTNPTPDFDEHFESFHVLIRPTYASMYPPAQGLAMSVTQIIFGSPAVAIVLTTALLCALLTWALQSWITPLWAFIAGVICIFRIDLLSYWGNAYWGGTIAAIGGCLVYGCVGRMRRRIRWQELVLFPFGLLLLANSRPYEGLVFSTLPTIYAAYLVVKRKRTITACAVVLPVLLLGAAFLLHYCKVVTGDAVKMPWFLQRQQYAPVPAFVFQHMGPARHYDTPELGGLYGRWELRDWVMAQFPAGLGIRILEKIDQNWRFFLGPSLGFVVLTLITAFTRPRTRFLTFAFLFALPFLIVETWLQAHYIAPAIVIIYAVIVGSIQRLHVLLRGHRLGLIFARATLFAILASVPLSLMTNFHEQAFPTTWALNNQPHPDWVRIHSDLNRFPGQHLVLVSYREPHDQFIHWVTNGADIPSQKVIWARSFGPERDRNLVCRYRDRTLWLLTPPETMDDEIPHDPRLGLIDKSSIPCP